MKYLVTNRYNTGNDINIADTMSTGELQSIANAVVHSHAAAALITSINIEYKQMLLIRLWP